MEKRARKESESSSVEDEDKDAQETKEPVCPTKSDLLVMGDTLKSLHALHKKAKKLYGEAHLFDGLYDDKSAQQYGRVLRKLRQMRDVINEQLDL